MLFGKGDKKKISIKIVEISLVIPPSIMSLCFSVDVYLGLIVSSCSKRNHLLHTLDSNHHCSFQHKIFTHLITHVVSWGSCAISSLFTLLYVP